MCLLGELSISMIFLCYGIPPSGLAHKNLKYGQWHGLSLLFLFLLFALAAPAAATRIFAELGAQ